MCRLDVFMNTRITGDKGEDIACIFLKNKGFKVIGRNYRKVWGEIDIIAQKTGIVHFFEVKSIVVSDLWHAEAFYRPEENVHGLKVRHIRRMIETYFEETGAQDPEFQFHVLCVFMSPKERRASVKWIKNIIL